MPKAKAKAKAKTLALLSGMIESDMENAEEISDVNMMPTPDSNQENSEPTKKSRGRPKAATSRFTRSKPSLRRTSGGSIVPQKTVAKKKAATKGAPLKEQANEEQAGESEEVDEFHEVAHDEKGRQEAASEDELDEPMQAEKVSTKRGKAVAKVKKPSDKEILEQTRPTENDGEFEYTPTTTRQNKLVSQVNTISKESWTARDKSVTENQLLDKVIPETQPMPVGLDRSMEDEGMVEVEDPVPQSVYKQNKNPSAISRHRQPAASRKRAASASDTDRGANEPATRRKLGEMTKKCESLEMRYRNLREIGIVEAEANYKELKKISDEKTKSANTLITALKKELVTQTALAQEGGTLQNQIIGKDAELGQAHATLAQLSSTLSQTENENKALQAKLAASRAASVQVESVNAKTPGSAMKGKTQSRTIMVGSAEAAQAAQIAQLKEDLYSDLTGLILRGVDRGDDSDLYDCIQTGRNGTLHFKLALANDSDGKISYEDTEFQYTPRLDGNRDRDLLELLPDYLSEEITFSRSNAAKFYSRIVETLTTKKMDD